MIREEKERDPPGYFVQRPRLGGHGWPRLGGHGWPRLGGHGWPRLCGHGCHWVATLLVAEAFEKRFVVFVTLLKTYI